MKQFNAFSANCRAQDFSKAQHIIVAKTIKKDWMEYGHLKSLMICLSPNNVIHFYKMILNFTI